ncbi:MAG: alpha/beta hydrolase, partial [Propionibacteriaceae bacterium]|nr:alpha/beta hydrolase [Propionibacteriaceae bacterium]
MTQRNWQPDFLPGYEQCLLPLERRPNTIGGDPEERFGAVLVRKIERPRTGRAVLYVHGWNDYFFQQHVADFWTAQGYDFYALDLRRYGRSWVEGQLRGFTTDLSEYFEELDQAVVELNRDHEEIVLTGHSTGGLIAALHAHERPGIFRGLVLNSPWLDLQGGPLARALGPVIKTLGAQRPTTVIPPTEIDFYRRTIHVSEGGEWDYDLALKSAANASIRVGWLKAVLQGHARVAAGLAISCPVLVLASTRSEFSRRWTEGMRTADIVLDVEQIASRAVRLGPVVTVARIEDAVHDVFLSPLAVRDRAF